VPKFLWPLSADEFMTAEDWYILNAIKQYFNSHHTISLHKSGSAGWGSKAIVVGAGACVARLLQYDSFLSRDDLECIGLS
jgi:hypothetical protein